MNNSHNFDDMDNSHNFDDVNNFDLSDLEKKFVRDVVALNWLFNLSPNQRLPSYEETLDDEKK
jgi:hypothetical protein